MKTQLKIIIRGLLRNKKYIVFSIIGLFISYSFFLLLFTYVSSELSYDTKMPDHENIYRVTMKVTSNGKTIKETAKTQMPLGQALKEKIPGILSYTRILDEETLFRYGEVKLNRQKTYWVDETFPELFSIEIMQGNAVDALSKNFSGILSEEITQKFFGNESPIGKVMIENEGLNMSIGGIFKKPEYNSHFDFDYLMSFKVVSFYNGFQNNWDTDMFYTYIKIDPNADLNEIKKRLDKFANETYVNHHAKNQKVELKLQPITSIHLHSKLENELSTNNNFSFIIILSILGLFTLLVSWLNFSGMVSSRYMTNQTTMLMNRIFGSPHRLINTIALEVFLLCFMSIIFATILITLFGSGIFNMLDVQVAIYPLHQLLIIVVTLLFISIIFCTAIAGAMLIGKHPKDGKIKTSSTKLLGNRQSSLIILQYSFSIFLIIFLGTTLKQIHFLKNTNPGYNKEQILAIHSPRTLIMNFERIAKGDLFISQLKQSGIATDGSITSDLPGKPVHTDLAGFVWLSPTDFPDVKIPADWISIDPGYLKTLGLKLIAGKNFEGDRLANKDKIIVNEKAVKDMGFESPEKAIGATINGNSVALDQSGKKLFTIAGVVSNFHQEGLQEEIKPMAFTHNYFYLFGFCALKLNNYNSNTIKAIDKTWSKIYPNDPFDYFFLDERFDQQYKNELLFFRLCLVFGLIATLIACFGLFGISVETLTKRRKEIGIRKVNGATILEITNMLNSTYIKWIIISFLLASPFAYFVAKKWLQSFAFQTNLSWWIFAIAGIVSLVIALATVSFQSWKAASKNPVESLRNE